MINTNIAYQLFFICYCIDNIWNVFQRKKHKQDFGAQYILMVSRYNAFVYFETWKETNLLQFGLFLRRPERVFRQSFSRQHACRQLAWFNKPEDVA